MGAQGHTVGWSSSQSRQASRRSGCSGKCLWTWLKTSAIMLSRSARSDPPPNRRQPGIDTPPSAKKYVEHATTSSVLSDAKTGSGNMTRTVQHAENADGSNILRVEHVTCIAPKTAGKASQKFLSVRCGWLLFDNKALTNLK